MWRNKDFESLNWHDSSVHSLSIEESKNGKGRLSLDMDYIVEWIKQDGKFMFRVASANLVFHDVSDLRISIDYASHASAISPFTIDNICRELFTYENGYKTYNWNIGLNWPAGSIKFLADDFSMEFTSVPIEVENQCLDSAKRKKKQ